ncbi:MAG: peptidase C39 family protein [Candidatus Woesearchaeota archaeon]
MEAYRQTTEYTGAAATLLTLLHHYDPEIPLNREEEFRIWHRTANLPVRAPSIYGLALVAQEHGLRPRIVLEEKEYDYPDYRFKGYTKKEVDEAKFSSKLYAKRAEAAGIPVEQREVTLKEVLKTLNASKKLLLRVNAGVFRKTGSTSKYVAVHQKQGVIKAVDPRYGELDVKEEELEEAMATLQTKKKRDVRMIVLD